MPIDHQFARLPGDGGVIVVNSVLPNGHIRIAYKIFPGPAHKEI